MRLLKTHSHSSERLGYEAEKELPSKKGKKGGLSETETKRQWKPPPCHLEGGGRGENVSTEERLFCPADDAMYTVTLGVYRYPLLGLPMMHVLVVTHLFGCVEIEIIALFLSWHEGN